MKKIIFFSTLFITFSFSAISQDEKSSTIDSQFNELIESSNSYQSYKVIKATELGTLQKNIRDSIINLRATIVKSEAVISEQKSKIDNFSSQIDTLKLELKQTQDNVEKIEFLGNPTHKSTYNSMMWGIVFTLLILSLVLFFLFKRGHSRTKEAKEKLASTEFELESLRKRSLEREQKVRRELQDEINKNRLRKE